MRSLFAFMLLLTATATACFAERPNIVLIMADDFGYECLGVNGGTSYHTPRLDQLANEGIRFTNCVAQPLCTPTRVKIMTGRYAFRNYVDFGTLPTSEISFGNLLKDAGYRTCIVGKWQLGRDRNLVGHFGFDEYCLWWLENKGYRYNDVGELIQNGTVLSGSSGEFNAEGKMVVRPPLEERIGRGQYGPDVVSRFAMDFMERNHPDKTGRPFFVYYPMMLTHDPFEPTPDSPPRPRADRQRKAEDIASEEEIASEWEQQNFADMVEYTDKIVGRIVDHLGQLGLRENTVVMFIGDNGTDRAITSQFNGRDWKGGKNRMSTEAGPWVPFVANWPAGGVQGAVWNDPIDVSDFFPSLAELAGASLPTDRKIDGHSFAGRLQGDPDHEPREWAYICHYGKKRGGFEECARDTQFVLMGTGELFDFVRDPLHTSPIDLQAAGEKTRRAQAQLNMVLSHMAAERAAADKQLGIPSWPKDIRRK